MKPVLLISLLLISIGSFAQKSDYLLLKKRNNRTLKAYFPGSFITGITYGGFGLNGIITDVRNDTVFVKQEDVQQAMTQFGTIALDTVVYTIGIYYKDIRRLDYTSHTGTGGRSRQSGFSQVVLPRIMILGGLGYLALESVNTVYRKESFNDKSKLTGMGVAAAIAGAGFLITRVQDHNRDAGGKYRIVYVNMR